MLKFVLYKFGQLCVNILPYSVSIFIAKRICDAQYLLNAFDRRAVKKNLTNILGDRPEIKRLTRMVFHNFGVYLVEFFSMRRLMSDTFIKERISVEGFHYVEETIRRGRGGIILSAHLGNWEMGGVLLSKMGFPLTEIVLSHNERSVNDLFSHQRSLFGNRIVQTQNAIRECARTFKENGLVALVADRDFTATGITMKFFGHDVHLPKGPALFSLKFDTPLIPTFFTREANGRFKLMILKPISPEAARQHPEHEAQVKELMNSYIHIFEEKIRTYPDQWLVFRDFTLQ